MRNTQGLGDPRLLGGTPVFDAEGEKVGAVHGYDEAGRYLMVTKGWFFPKDTYVPLDTIARSDADGVYLRLTQEELRGQQWETAPEDMFLTDREATGTVDLATGDLRVPVYQEELTVETRVAEAGRIHVRKEVLSEEETITIPLRQERVTVERAALGGEIDSATIRDAFVERDFEIALLGEEAVVEKRVAGVEEVVVHKNVVTVQERVTDTVRKERVRIEGDGRTEGPSSDQAGQGTGRRRGKKRTRR